MAQYVTIRRDEIEPLLAGMGFVVVKPPGVTELVMARRARVRGQTWPLSLRVFTSVARDGVAREAGADAIRVALVWRDAADQIQPVKSFRRVHRVEGWRTNLLERIEEASTFAPTPCPQCGAPMVLRASARGQFWGCGRFPACRVILPVTSHMDPPDRIGIIGTAGRGAEPMSAALYANMLADARARVAEWNQAAVLVSGGAAWADQLAVSLFLETGTHALELYLPCEFKDGAFVARGPDSPGHIANYYHTRFADQMGRDMRQDISAAIARGALVAINPGGFLARNLQVGNVDALLAYTWGVGSVPADGGTRHTWNHSSAPLKVHVPLSGLRSPIFDVGADL